LCSRLDSRLSLSGIGTSEKELLELQRREYDTIRLAYQLGTRETELVEI
jgi:hypothetical protein